MPNIKSAKKRVLIAESRRVKNAAIRSGVKTSIKKFTEAVTSGDKENAQVLLINAIKKLDKAAGKGVLHKKAAARKKSRLQKIFNKASQA
ncbi:MAG: 30S ribosomal protein S20 [Bacillota bacterium]|jgi:small subunit ribosomal protein S20|nr:30S ribosomal protein S20 [Clostridia bacterium]